MYNDHYNNTDYRDTLFGTPSDIIDFRTDGKVYTNVFGQYDTSTYSVPSETQLIIDTTTFNIQTLTDNTLKLYSKETDRANYTEETENLIR